MNMNESLDSGTFTITPLCSEILQPYRVRAVMPYVLRSTLWTTIFINNEGPQGTREVPWKRKKLPILKWLTKII